jgi:hypothetical protein
MTSQHRVQIWHAPDDKPGKIMQVIYCDEPECQGYGHEVERGVCYPRDAQIRLVTTSRNEAMQ